MKKIYSLLMLSAVAYPTAAQQLPSVGFEGEWEKNVPWNSVTDTLSFINATLGMEENYPNGIFGLQPKGWIIANVNGVVSEKFDDDDNLIGYAGLGATQVGYKVVGYNSESAVILQNSPNPFMPTQIVPAYLSLGKTWGTNTLDWTTFAPANKDGGVFGGMEISSRPDALAFVYQREYAPAEGDADNAQNATVLVYAWKGTWTQKDVPANNSMSAETVKVTMTDRDRNILGMTTDQGGEVTKSDDAELIAKSLDQIVGEKKEWTEYFLPIEYLSDAMPTKINVVIAANDYFDSQRIVNGNSLTVDNVRFVYYSRLGEIKVNGVAIEGFDSNTYEYSIAGTAPAIDKIETVILGGGKSAQTGVSVNGKTITITVANDNGADIDGRNEHSYVLNFDEAASSEQASYAGYLNIEMGGAPMAENTPATIQITKTGENTCTFVLPNFSLDLGGGPTPLGDIVVPDVTTSVENGVTTYKGEVKGLTLMQGALVADVDLQGTIDAAGQADMVIEVMWNGIPIHVTFTSKLSGIAGVIDENAPIEYYNLNGIRVESDQLPAGIYIRRQGNKTDKVIIR